MMFGSLLALLAGTFGVAAVAGLSGGSASRETSPDDAARDPVSPVEPPVTPIVAPLPDAEPVSPVELDPTPVVSPGSDPDPVLVPGPVTPPSNPGSQPITPGDEANTAGSVTLGNNASGTFFGTVVSGRATTLNVDTSSLTGIEVLDKPAYGNLTVNPDKSLALVLSGTSQTEDLAARVRLTFEDGSTAEKPLALNVVPGDQAAGWGKGHFYMLETDDAGDLVIETGEVHRKVYVSGDEQALTLDDINALENMSLSTERQWANFFAGDTEYGSTSDMALAEDAGNILWRSLVNSAPEGHSHWLLFEKGHTYNEMDILYRNGGESELHPMYIGAYGEGDRPVLDKRLNLVARDYDRTENIVLDGVKISDGARFLFTENTLLNDVVVTEKGMTAEFVNKFTLRDSHILDVVRDQPVDGSDTWLGHPNRVSGFYSGHTSEGMLLENNFFGMNGWAEGYDFNLSADAPQPPSMYSHNVYLNSSLRDTTMRDNIVFQAASSGTQMRPGGFIEDNVFIDNNGALNLGSDQQRTNYTLFADNLVTSGAHKKAAAFVGELTYGISNEAMSTTLVDNIVTHLADPANPQEYAEKTTGQHALWHRLDEPFFDDTIIYNWKASVSSQGSGLRADQNIEGLDTTVLDETTIQKFTAQLLGKQTATISDLSDYLRAEAEGRVDDVVDADLINAFFQQGFGLDTTLRSEAATLRFVPNPLGDGIRWDNRLNWDSGDLPGTQDGDRVELAGNWVEFGGNAAISDLDFGSDGRLNVNFGRLTVEDHISVGDAGARLTTDGAGQFWANGYSDSDLLTIEAEGGRFANTGLWTGTTDLTASDNAQVLLATDGADYVMGEGSTLRLEGGGTKVGFDGEEGGTAVLLMNDKATVEYSATDGDISEISEFESGRFDDAGAGVRSGINLGGSMLRIDLTGYTQPENRIDLMSADELIGQFGLVEVNGLGARNAVLQVDYESDRVSLVLGQNGVGKGAVAIETLGAEASAQSDTALYDALTNGHGIYPEDRPEDVPAEEDDDAFAL